MPSVAIVKAGFIANRCPKYCSILLLFRGFNVKTRVKETHSLTRVHVADGGGFEPPGRDRRPLVFKTSSFGRSDNHPDEDLVYLLSSVET